MDVWTQVLSAVGRRVSQQSFDTWFRPISFCGSDDTRVIDSRVSEPGDSIRRRRRP